MLIVAVQYDDNGSFGGSFTLGQLRKMHAAGELSEQEYEDARRSSSTQLNQGPIPIRHHPISQRIK